MSDRVVGLHVCGPHAGEMTQGFAVALKCGATKEDFETPLYRGVRGELPLHFWLPDEFTQEVSATDFSFMSTSHNKSTSALEPGLAPSPSLACSLYQIPLHGASTCRVVSSMII